MIVASSDPVETVAAQHRRLLSLQGGLEAADFILLLDAQPAANLADLLDSLDLGTLTVAGHQVGIDEGEPSWRPIRGQRMFGNHQLGLGEQRYWHYTYTVKESKPPEEYLQASGVDPSSLQLSSWHELNNWLGAAFFDPSNRAPINLLLAFPVYIEIDQRPSLNGKELVVTGSAHTLLQVALKGRVRINSSGQQAKASIPLNMPEPPTVGMSSFEARCSLAEAGLALDDYVEIRLYHDSLGELKTLSGLYYQNRNLPESPLLAAARLFEGGVNLPRYLVDATQPKQNTPPARFEAAWSWLLSVIGIPHIDLSMLREAEEMRRDGVHVGSADILAYHPKMGLCVMDCTRSTPDAQKADSLLNTANAVSAQLDLPVYAAVIAPVDLVVTRREWAGTGISLVDKRDVGDLLKLCSDGYIEAAQNHFFMLIRPGAAATT